MATVEPTKLRTFGRNLAVCLLLIKKTTKDLAADTGIRANQLDQLESGEATLSSDDLLLIANELNISILHLTKTYGGSEHREEQLAEVLKEAGHTVYFEAPQKEPEISPYKQRPPPGIIVEVLPNGSILTMPAKKERRPGRYNKTKSSNSVTGSR